MTNTYEGRIILDNSKNIIFGNSWYIDGNLWRKNCSPYNLTVLFITLHSPATHKETDAEKGKHLMPDAL